MVGVIDGTGASVDSSLVGLRVLVDPALYDGDGPEATPVRLLGSERDGGFAGYAVVDAGRLHDVKHSPLSDDQLAALPVAYGTAMGMLDRAGVAAEQQVLVTGASGGVGLAAVQLASRIGARVVALTTAETADAVVGAGADVALDRRGDVPVQCAFLAEATDVHDLLQRAIDWFDATTAHGCLLLRAAAEHPGVEPVEREVERYHRQLHTVLGRLTDEHADELFLVHEGLGIHGGGDRHRR